MSKKRGWILLISVIVLMGGVIAQVEYVGNEISKKYTGGSKIEGTINLSFVNESTEGVFTSNFLGNVTLIDLLQRNGFAEGEDYNCSTSGCLADYNPLGEVRHLKINASTSKTLGFRLSGREVNVRSLKFYLSSDMPPSCNRQMQIDLFGEREDYFQNYRYSNTSCGNVTFGCFSAALASGEYALADIPDSGEYCERVFLPVAPAFEVGAAVKNSTSGKSRIKMQLMNEGGSPLEECFLPAHKTQNEELKCTINYTSLRAGSFFVCISAESSGADYKIRTEDASSVCGTTDPASQIYDRDYELFAEALQFEWVEIEVNRTNFERMNPGKDFIEEANAYLEERYGSDCSKGCFLPLKVTGMTQNLNFSGIEMKYESAGTVLTSTTLYSLEKTPSRISTRELEIDLIHANFTIPFQSSENTLEILFAGESLVEIGINLTKGFDFDVSPKFALLGISTNFTIQSNGSISRAIWDFGDDSPVEQTSAKSNSHKYLKNGEYILRVSAYSADGKTAAKNFRVEVGNARDSAAKLITRYHSRIANLTVQMANYPPLLANELKERISLEDMKARLNSLENEFSVSVTDEEYSLLVGKLLEMDVPYAVLPFTSANPPLISFIQNAELSYILELSGKGNASVDEGKLREGISGWVYENYDASASYKQMSSYKDSGREELITYFKITLSPKKEFEEEKYLIIGYPLEGIKFVAGEGARAAGAEGTYLSMRGRTEVEFTVPGAVSPSEIGIYLSPEIRELNIENLVIDESDEPGFRTGWFIALIAILAGVTLGGYIFLQEWYKKNYESHLFKNRDELYNLINFIHNSRFTNLSDSEVKKKLSGAGWRGEQMEYAFRKLDGKRTGMFEIPLFKGRENKIVMMEIAKRQMGGERFIKRH